MGGMTQWADIEAAPVAATRRSAPTPAGRRRTLRRHSRLVLGSIDHAGYVLSRRGRVMLVGSAVFLIPVVAVNLVTSVLVFDRFDSFDGAVVSLPELFGSIESATGVETLLSYLGLLTTSLSAALVGGYAASVLLQHRFGDDVTMPAALWATLRRSPALIAAWLISHGWMLLGAWLMVRVSGASWAPLLVVLVPAVGLAVAAMLLVSPVIMVEHLGPLRAVRRAWKLGRSRFGATLGFVCAATVVGGGLRLGLTWLPRLASTTGLVTFGPYGWLIEGIAGQVAQLVTVPLVALATAEFYLQVRVQAEGMDIMIAADDAFGPAR
jgi:hypothetical protein